MVLIRRPILKILYALQDKRLTDIPSEISEYRKNKILSKRTQNDRSLAIISAILLEKACKDYGIDEKNVKYGEGLYGKPYFESDPQLSFSLAHSKSMVVLAIDEHEIGIDCEYSERRITSNVAKRFFYEKEVSDFENALLALWVTKESLCKLSGKGLAAGAKETCVPFYASELKLDDIFIKRFDIDDYTVVVSSKHEISAIPEKINI